MRIGYAKAHVLFAKKQYREALRLALSGNMITPISKILLRYLITRAQYELDMLDELQIELETLHYHLKDNRLSDERRQKTCRAFKQP